MRIRLTENQIKQLSALLLEDQESNAMKQAVNYLIQNGQSPERAKEIFNAIRNDIPSVRLPLYTNNNGREKGLYKFAIGVERMYLNGELNDGSVVMKLNKTLKLLANGHADEYDNNLNGLSARELNTRFEGAAKQDLENDKNNVSSEEYVNNGYTVVRIPDAKTAAKYGEYTSWCVTHNKGMYGSYTSNGLGLFYFFLKDGFEKIKPIKKEGCPLDEYGLSMIAVSVNFDGSLNTVTCRWNHDNGGNDNIMDAKQLSRVVGMNVYEVCKPYTRDELHAKGIILFDEVQGLLDSGKKPEKIFDAIFDFKDGFTRVRLNGKYSFIDETNKLIGDGNQWFDSADDFNEGFVRVLINGKGTFIDKNGKLIGNGKRWFNYVSNFQEGLAVVGLNGKYSLIDKNGKLIGNGKRWFDDILKFQEGFARVLLNGKYSFIDKNGKLIGNRKQWYDGVSNFKEGFARVGLNGKYSLIDKNGKLIGNGNQWFDYISDFQEGFSRVLLNGKYSLINENGKLIGNGNQWFDFVSNYFSEGFAQVELNGKFFFIDKTGNLYDENKNPINKPMNESLKKSLDLIKRMELL